MRITLSRIGIIALFFLLWEVVVTAGAVNPRLLPPPSAVLQALIELFEQGAIYRHLAVTSLEVLVAFIIVVPLGIALGLLLGENEYLGRLLGPLVYFLFSVPKSIFLPLFILAFGIGFSQKVVFGAVSAIFVLVMCTLAAVESVSADLVRVAKAFGANQWQIAAKVYLPCMLPLIIEGLRLGIIFNFTGVMLSEMYASKEGLGNVISYWGENFMLPKLFSGIIIAGMCSILLNEILRGVERHFGRWRT